MLRQLVVLLLVCAPNLVLCRDERSPTEDELADFHEPPVVALPFIQNNQDLIPTLRGIKNGMVQAYPGFRGRITKQMEALEGLPDANEEKTHSLFRNFFDAQLKLFGAQDNEVGDYRGLLTQSDRELLGEFRNISTVETQLLLACPSDFLPLYQIQENTEHKPTWGEVICALRLMLQEMTNLNAIILRVAMEVFKSVHLTYSEYATSVFHSNQVSGDILVLPLVLAQKMYETTPRKRFGEKSLRLSVAANSPRSEVFNELAANGVTAEEVIELIIKRIVKYYEKLEKDVFCKIRYRVSHLMSEHSLASIALNFADAHACFGTRQPEKKKPEAGQ